MGCGSCVADGPVLVLAMRDEVPVVAPQRADICIKCLHCLTVCPTGAVSIGGFAPEDCLELSSMLPEADKMEVLIRGLVTTPS